MQSQTAPSPTDRWSIQLLSGTITPTTGLDAAAEAALESRIEQAREQGIDKIYTLLQFDRIPTEAEKGALQALGIELQTYVPNYAWMAAIHVSNTTNAIQASGLRWVGDWSAEDKLHPDIMADSWGEWAIHPSENMVMVIMLLHLDVPLDRGEKLAQAHGGVAMPPIEGIHGLTVWMPKGNLPALAGEDEVVWIEQGPPPLSPTNDGARESMQVDPLYSAPYSLDGSGVRVFVFDGGAVLATHNTFNPGSRVTVFDSTAVDDHPTHVAGTVAGDGDGGQAQGMAPAATILSAGYQQLSGTMLFWDNAGDIQADYATARNTYNADFGTNSIGSNTASNGYDCDREGDYGVTSNMLDGIVRGDNPTVGSPVLMTWANGNERTGYTRNILGTRTSAVGRCGANYRTTAPPSCAKNPIHVGAINSDYDSMTSFSSWGPCDDGRMKPIISASGCELGRASGETSIYSSLSTSNNAWGGMCGTSMATPATAGVVALMIEDWRAQGYGGTNDRPLPALFKAMLIHTARDLGQDGPDYIYGYGEIDAQAAVDLIREGNALGGAGPTNWGTDSISQGQTDTFNLTVPAGTAELKVSLAWDDYAAAAYSAYAPVNDLNLEVVAPDSTVHYPWVLGGLAAPHQPATTGVNSIDNQEQVLIADPAPGTWTVRVLGTTVPQGPQTYGLIYSTHAPTYHTGSCAEQIANGDFETTAAWTLNGAVRDTAQKHDGAYSLRLGGATDTNHSAYQQITIPAGQARAEFSFWWYMTTNEGGDPDGHSWDKFYAEVRDTSDAVLATFDYRSDGWPQGQWLKSENMDLTPWVGQAVRLYFYATNNSSRSTAFYVDDVGLETCPPPPTSPDFAVTATPESQDICAPNDAVYAVEIDSFAGFNDPVTLSASGNPGTATFVPNPVTPPADGSSNGTLTLSGGAAGSYNIDVIGTSGSQVRQDTVMLSLYNAAPTAPTPTAPTDGSTGQSTTPTFTWSAVTGATGYSIDIATDPGFSTIVDSATGLTGTSYAPGSPLNPDTVYYWRVQAANICGPSSNPVTWAFRTEGYTCITYDSTDVPQAITDRAWSESDLSVTQSFVFDDVDVTVGQIIHTYDADLDVYIRHPDSTEVTLSTDNGGSGDNYVDTVFDQEASTSITSGGAPFTGRYQPEGDLSALYNKTSQGTWTLRVYDDSNWDTGTLDAWSLTLCGQTSSTSADYSDLASSYGIAWHTGDGALRLGSSWTADTTFADGSDDSDDGVTFVGAFQAGQQVTARVNVQGTPTSGRWLRLWFDWDDDGVFDDSEKAYDGTANNGDNNIPVNVPPGYSAGVHYRARLYDSASGNATIQAQDTVSFGPAAGGEVEDGTTPIPTGVVLADFQAWADGPAIIVGWETASELDILGFNVLRSDAPDGPYSQVNEELIPSLAPGLPTGETYTWTDTSALPKITYYYKLEVMDTMSTPTLHGPVSATIDTHFLFLPLLIEP